MKEIIFSEYGARCHAKVVKDFPVGARYEGKMEGYEVYSVNGIIFDPFGFVAIKKD